jgi:polysaccharide biosynthesis protein PslA
LSLAEPFRPLFPGRRLAPPSEAFAPRAAPRAASLPAMPDLRRGPLRPAQLAPVRARMDGGWLRRLFRATDVAAVALAVAAAAALGGEVWSRPLGAMAPLAFEALAALGVLAAADAYRFGRCEPKWLQPLRLAGALLAAALAGPPAALWLPRGDPDAALRGLEAVAVALALSHGWAALRVRAWRREGRLTPNVVLVGATPDAGRLIDRALQTREVNVLGVFDDRGQRAPKSVRGVPVLGDTAALIDHRLLPYVDRVVVALNGASQARLRTLAERLRVLPNALTLTVDLSGEEGRAEALARLLDAPLTQGAGADGARAFSKRACDLVLASVALVLLAPAMLLTALAVKLDSAGPALFRQRREGFNNEPITVLKFRSLRADACDPTASQQVRPDDARVTRVGRVIRQASLDELPQLLNVIRGEMSLVGPRPHAIGMKTAGADTRALVAEYAWRHRMKPGLTGWAQVNGSRGPVHTAEDVRRRVALDLAYVERQSFWFDLWILLITVPRLLGDWEAAR